MPVWCRGLVFAAIVSVMAALAAVPQAQAAHPLSLMEAQVYVTRSSARLRVKLFAEDLFLFHDLEPNQQDVLSPEQLREGLKLHRQFLLDKITLRDAKGELYKGSVTDMQPFEMPAEGISVEELMLHTATYELEYPFTEPPEFLTIQQDVSDEAFIFPSEMKLTLHQAGTDLVFTESLKPGAAETIRFDWSGDVLSDEASDAEWQAWFEKQREATLGITSYSSVYSFIYIEPAEVRHEVLIPLANLRTVLPMEHEDPAFVDVDEQDGVRELIRNWLKDENPTSINGTSIAPEFTRIDFYGLDLKDFARQAEERRVSLANGRIGIIMTYRSENEAVRDVKLSWDSFNSAIRKIQSVVVAYPDQMQRFEFSRFNKSEDNVFAWSADPANLPQPTSTVPAVVPPMPTMDVPVASLMLVTLAIACLLFARRHKRRIAVALLVLAAVMFPFANVAMEHPFKERPKVADDKAYDVFETLHAGAYRALDFGTEDRIYEVLGNSVDGDLLEKTYLQLREGLQMREQGGAVARVQSVKYDDGERIDQDAAATPWPGFAVRSRWTVSGTVEHWGHIHERQNQFSAVFNVEPRDGLWKITDMQIEDQQSLATNTRLRKF